jgi:hypothetical protein
VSSTFSPPSWFWSDSWQDTLQDRAIEDLAMRQRRHNREAEERRRKSEQQLAGRIEAASSELTDRIETLYAWADLRFELAEFDEHRARVDIRSAFRALAEGRPARLPETRDTPGYWLPPAAAAILPLVLRGRPGTEPQPPGDLTTGLATARDRDPVRAELFNLAVGRCFNRPVLIDAAFLRLIAEPPHLGTAGDLPSPAEGGPGATEDLQRTADGHRNAANDGGGTAAGGQRTTAGGLGTTESARATAEDGKDAAESGRPAAEPVQVAAAWRTLWEHAAHGVFGPDAAVQLAGRLRDRFDPEALDDTELKEWDRAIADFANGATLAAALTALRDHLAAEPAAAPGDTDTAWRRYLQELIEAPSPAELPLVRRLEELAPAGAPRRSRPSWAEPAGTVAELVRRDLFDPEAPTALRRLALDLAAPLLHARLAHLESGLRDPEPAVVPVRRRGASVDVTAAGHDPEAAAAAEAHISRGFTTDGPSKPAYTALVAGIGAVTLLLAVFGQWVLAALAAATAAFPLLVHRSESAKARKETEQRDDRLADLRSALIKARNDAADLDRERAERHRADRAALDRLRAALPPAR